MLFAKHDLPNKVFIAGTDTEIGKTYASCALLRAWAAQGYSTLGIKPMAAGAEFINGCWQNEDALALQSASTIKADYPHINPYCLRTPTSPHLVTHETDQSVRADLIVQACQPALDYGADKVLCEGAGGWYAPINEQQTMADIALDLNWPVILVVGIRLGCLNHTRLTYEAIMRTNLPIVGWVANHIDANMCFADENVAFLAKYLDTPLLATLPYQEEASVA